MVRIMAPLCVGCKAPTHSTCRACHENVCGDCLGSIRHVHEAGAA